MNKPKTVAQFCETNPFTPSAMRGLIFKANPRMTHDGEAPGNGLIEAGAILRIGRKILIDEEKFYEWVEQQQPVRRAK